MNKNVTVERSNNLDSSIKKEDEQFMDLYKRLMTSIIGVEFTEENIESTILPLMKKTIAFYNNPSMPKLKIAMTVISMCHIILAIRYMMQDGIIRDAQKAKEHFETSIDVGKCYLHILNNDSLDNPEVTRDFMNAEKRGYDFMTPYNDTRNISIYEPTIVNIKEIETEHHKSWISMSYFNLGNMYEQGQGVARDWQRAREYFEAAVNTYHNNNAKLSLALMYHNGMGVAKNYHVAEQLYNEIVSDSEYLEASAQKIAANNLGYMYAHDLNPNEDHDMLLKAIDYYRLAGALGSAIAFYNLGILYETSESLNHQKSYYYYRKAAQMGNKDAEAALKELKTKKRTK